MLVLLVCALYEGRKVTADVPFQNIYELTIFLKKMKFQFNKKRKTLLVYEMRSSRGAAGAGDDSFRVELGVSGEGRPVGVTITTA